MKKTLIITLIFLYSLILKGDSVILAWDANTELDLAGYKLHYGTISKTYTNHVDVKNVTTFIITNLNTNITYYFAATAYNIANLESDFSNEINFKLGTIITNIVSTNIIFEAESGQIFFPFLIENYYVYQNNTTVISTGGRAIYNFEIIESGLYTLDFLINTPSEAENSLYINIDAEPTDPYMIFDVPVTVNFESRFVSWRGNGDFNKSEFVPKIFNLNQGIHQLIIIGRERNTKIDSIKIIKNSIISIKTPTGLKIQ